MGTSYSVQSMFEIIVSIFKLIDANVISSYLKVMSRVQQFIFVWTSSCTYFYEIVSRNAPVGLYKSKLLNKCNNAIITDDIPATSLLEHYCT